MTVKPPRWTLSNIYPSLDSPAIQQDFDWIDQKILDLRQYFAENAAPLNAQTDPQTLAQAISGLLERCNTIKCKVSSLRGFLAGEVSTDSYNTLAAQLFSVFQKKLVKLEIQDNLCKKWLGSISPALPAVIAQAGQVQAHAFYLNEMAQQSQYLMSEAEEALASELSLSGARAWETLQGVVTSQVTVDFELDGKTETLSMPALINLHAHADESVRRRAYEAELKAWDGIKQPVAAALNGIKGANIVLDQRRGRQNALDSALEKARIDRETLDAMIGAMTDAFPVFQKYFKAKAARFNQQKLPWWNLFAPLGNQEAKTYTFDEASEFVMRHFARFTPEMADFAGRAFDNGWIDAEARPGKRAGAYCMGIPSVKESRIFCNFDGSLDQVMTIAHELGHGFHNYCMFKANKTELQRITPMTMAETASIMCETIVFEAIVNQVKNPQEELAILETSLIGDSQVIVDIASRFLFEKEVFARRAKGDISADELCDIMHNSQMATYGDGLDEQYTHPYMWVWKPHYYMPNLSFYNFPYAFGLLFGLGLYAIYQQQGDAFVADYQNLLASTGEADAATLAARFGINIRDRAFWQSSLAVIGKRIERYTQL